MKKTLYILLLLNFAVMFSTCKKHVELNVYRLELLSVTAEVSRTDYNVTVQYSYPTKLSQVVGLISRNSDMSEAVRYPGDVGDVYFEVIFSDLQVNSEYYYCFEYSNGLEFVKTDAESFRTNDYSMPFVTTNDVTDITAIAAVCGGNITDDGGFEVTARGICWSTNQNPSIIDMHTTDGTGAGIFSSSITGLTIDTTYYVRAYATTSKGTSYGGIREFTTQNGLATVTTSEVTNITAISAICGGNVIDSGGLEVIERGICWSSTQTPTITDNHTTDGTGMGIFTSSITELSTSTTYYVRAYATTNKGTSYGAQNAFTTQSGSPIVTTSSVKNITGTTAICGGNVTDDGGLEVIARGVCWSTYQNPTINDYHTYDGSGIGMFDSSLNNLNIQTTYYVVAYATNERGTVYGEQKQFTTKDGLPTVTTNNVINITATSATCGGYIISDGGFEVTARGVCWSTSQNPTINDSHTSDGSGTGSFTSSLNNLSDHTIYYVRAYATNYYGTKYGPQKEFLAKYPGTLSGVFSVSDTQQVCFSQGNLQYQASTNSWLFAANQYDYIGNDNCHISSSYNGWIDLFGWGTSGYNHGAVCFQPYSTSTNQDDYLAYGNDQYNLYDQTGMADWGYNAIVNGGNTTNMWRTLTGDEWTYVFITRSTPSGIRYAFAQVNGVNGIILLPDDWSNSIYNLNNTNTSTVSFATNTITKTNWSILESAGAVFLPAAGYRNGTGLQDVHMGCYWSASRGARAVYFNDGISGSLNPNNLDRRNYGQSVRLVWSFQRSR